MEQKLQRALNTQEKSLNEEYISVTSLNPQASLLSFSQLHSSGPQTWEAPESPRGQAKTQVTRPCPVGLGWAWGHAFLTSSQVWCTTLWGPGFILLCFGADPVGCLPKAIPSSLLTDPWVIPVYTAVPEDADDGSNTVMVVSVPSAIDWSEGG